LNDKIKYGLLREYRKLKLFGVCGVTYVAVTCVNYNPLIKMIFMHIRTVLIHY